MIEVNGRHYHVEKLSIMQSLVFAPEVIEAVGPSLGGLLSAFQDGTAKEEVFKGLFGAIQSSKLTAVMKKSLAQIVTPENTYLRDTSVLEEWFQRHPQDLFMVAGLATWELTKDFLPQPLTTIVGGFTSKAKASKSPKDGK